MNFSSLSAGELDVVKSYFESTVGLKLRNSRIMYSTSGFILIRSTPSMMYPSCSLVIREEKVM